MSLKPAYKQTEVAVIPDGWQTKTLGSLLDYEQPTPFLVISTNYLDFSSVPVLTAGKTFILGYTDEEHGVYKSLPVILFDDFTTACQWVDFPFKVKSSAAKILSGRVGVSDTKFMHEYLSRLSYVPSDHQRHWISVFSSIEVIVPPLKEQKAIAEALSDVDALIDSLEALLTKKRNIKTGVMQELLTGRTRLRGFSGEWQTSRIGSLTSCISGGTPSTLVAEYWGGPIRWMSSGELNLKRVCEVDGRITEAGLHSSSTKMVPAKCVLIGLAGQGKTRGTAAVNFIELCTNQSIAAILPSKSHDSEFLYYVLDTKYEELRGLSDGGGGRGGLNLSIIKAIQVTLPGINEQKAIAKVLSDIDDEIEALEKRLAKTRDLKQGMAQELLTGRTRLV